MIFAALIRAGDFVRALAGWRRMLFAFAMGLASVLSFAPFFVFPAMLLGFAALMLLIDGAQKSARPITSAAFAGWAFGFGFFAGGLYWIAYAFLVDAVAHAWQIPFAIGFLSAFLALYMAAAGAVTSALWRAGPSRIFVLAACYGIAEWLRGHLLTGFPWNLPAYGWGASLGVMQGNAVFGAYGVSLLTVLFGASLACLCERRTRAWILPASVTALFLLMGIAGEIRLAETPVVYVPGVNLRIVQPDVPQTEKYALEYRVRNWRELMDLSLSGNGPRPTHIIWPEAAPPFLLMRQPEALDDIALLTAQHTVLMTGAVRIGDDGRAFNSFIVFAHGGQAVSTYDKFHLVPFGEYLPLKSLFNALGISKLVDSPGDFTPGNGPQTIEIPGAPAIGPLICYEILFPGSVVGETRPGWLVNVTDDSWFGPPSSTGPQQHFLTARVRAIETGLPVVRAANTGISAVIDGDGRVLASLGAGKLGVLDHKLPQALHSTIYSRIGDGAFVMLIIACFALAFAWRTDARQPGK
ncbi:MAG TPA: apolipoprotein N-acyltransferase [Rhizomicrobium sp.]|jgi:apolipoprotein N-acyltransferase|nr:apolipoprotein N-acyltransferase [Rhizomicrobium sp.]